MHKCSFRSSFNLVLKALENERAQSQINNNNTCFKYMATHSDIPGVEEKLQEIEERKMESEIEVETESEM